MSIQTKKTQVFFLASIMAVLCGCSVCPLKVSDITDTLVLQHLANNTPYAAGTEDQAVVSRIAERFQDIRRNNLSNLIQKYNIQKATFMLEYMHTHFRWHCVFIFNGNTLYWWNTAGDKVKMGSMHIDDNTASQLERHASSLLKKPSDRPGHLSLATSMFYLTFFSQATPAKTYYFCEKVFYDQRLWADHASQTFDFFTIVKLISRILIENGIKLIN